MLNKLQKYCLDRMGITRWRSVSSDATYSQPFIVYYSKNSNTEVQDQDFLNKILKAIGWPVSSVSFLEPHQEDLLQRTRESPTLKGILWFSALKLGELPLALLKFNEVPVLQLPPLETLQKDQELKRQAWFLMKKLF